MFVKLLRFFTLCLCLFSFSEHGRRLNSPDLIEYQKDTETTSELPDVPLILPATKEKSSKFEF